MSVAPSIASGYVRTMLDKAIDGIGPLRSAAATADSRLVDAGGELLETLSAFLDANGALEATARALFVHANTVRYRMRRIAELCGHSPMDARGALTLQLALVLGRLAAGDGG